MQLYKIIYFSCVDDPDVIDINAILKTSQENNAVKNITGILLFNSGFFLQVLEGPRSEVSATYNRIARDRRHSGVTLLIADPTPVRRFGDWDMRYLARSSIESVKLRKYSGTKDFDPRHMTLESITYYLEELQRIDQPEQEIAPVARAS